MLLPSEGRAALLNKAYMALVQEQSFEKGRETLIAPPENVHREIENEATDLAEADKVYYDGRLWLDWGWTDRP